MSTFMQQLEREKNAGWVPTGNRKNGACVKLSMLVVGSTSKTVKFKDKNKGMQIKERVNYTGAFKDVVPLVDNARKTWDKQIQKALEGYIKNKKSIKSPNQQSTRDDDDDPNDEGTPFEKVIHQQFDASRCGPGASREKTQAWVSEVRALWEKTIEESCEDNSEAVGLANALKLAYVPIADDAIRFVLTAPTDQDDSNSFMMCPKEDMFVIRENQFDSNVSAFGGTRTPPFTVIEIGSYCFKLVQKGQYAGRIFSSCEDVQVNVVDGHLTLYERVHRFVDIPKQRCSLLEKDEYDPRTFVIRVDKRSQLPTPNDRSNIHAEVHFEGYVPAEEGEGYGHKKEDSCEAFRFTPKPNDYKQGMSIMPSLGMQIHIMQWGPPKTPDNLNQRTYFESFRLMMRLMFEHCNETPFIPIDQWCAHMQANPIPFLVAFNINSKKTYEHNPSATTDTIDNLKVRSYAKKVVWLLPEYVLKRCVPVSAQWVLEQFQTDTIETNETVEYQYLGIEEDPKVHTHTVSKIFSKNPADTKKDPEKVKLINLSDYLGSRSRFVNQKGEAQGGWRFAVAVAEVEYNRKTNLIEQSRLPPELAAAAASEHFENWPATPEAGDSLMRNLSNKPRATTQELFITILAHKYEESDLEVPNMHPTYAVPNVPKSSTHAEPFNPSYAAATATATATAAAAAAANDHDDDDDDEQEDTDRLVHAAETHDDDIREAHISKEAEDADFPSFDSADDDVEDAMDEDEQQQQQHQHQQRGKKRKASQVASSKQASETKSDNKNNKNNKKKKARTAAH